MGPLRYSHRKLAGTANNHKLCITRPNNRADNIHPYICGSLISLFSDNDGPAISNRANFMVKPFDRLVLVSSTHYCASTPSLSPGDLPGVLSFSRMGISYLKVGFTLICFQRLSRPNLAIQLCRWRDNWCTRGSSIPVLSY